MHVPILIIRRQPWRRIAKRPPTTPFRFCVMTLSQPPSYGLFWKEICSACYEGLCWHFDSASCRCHDAVMTEGICSAAMTPISAFNLYPVPLSLLYTLLRPTSLTYPGCEYLRGNTVIGSGLSSTKPFGRKESGAIECNDRRAAWMSGDMSKPTQDMGKHHPKGEGDRDGIHVNPQRTERCGRRC